MMHGRSVGEGLTIQVLAEVLEDGRNRQKVLTHTAMVPLGFRQHPIEIDDGLFFTILYWNGTSQSRCC